jgi:hypothetical protein
MAKICCWASVLVWKQTVMTCFAAITEENLGGAGGPAAAALSREDFAITSSFLASA